MYPSQRGLGGHPPAQALPAPPTSCRSITQLKGENSSTPREEELKQGRSLAPRVTTWS